MTEKKKGPEVYSRSRLTEIVKKQRKRIKNLKEELKAVKKLGDRTKEEFAKHVSTTDKMSVAIRACMAKLNLTRGDISKG
jgi:phage-related tail protein